MATVETMTLVELDVTIQQILEKWRRALQAGEYVWAAYYANDLEVATRRLTTITHHYVKDHHANPEAALAGHSRSPLPPAEGDRR